MLNRTLFSLNLLKQPRANEFFQRSLRKYSHAPFPSPVLKDSINSKSFKPIRQGAVTKKKSSAGDVALSFVFFGIGVSAMGVGIVLLGGLFVGGVGSMLVIGGHIVGKVDKLVEAALNGKPKDPPGPNKSSVSPKPG